ncbi:transposable element Tcb2 transposase [Trichonephila clavipes]|uniref:Transposable element Tcb2 transposase n=1 Tax=Trichonephila clavipes TaxID=2585209 RepID=A0A8X6SBR2_TRICX|nr:transposable element Tcb2 transposase [Trichonephila clavipes]
MYPRAVNRVWSDQEDYEERGSNDSAASTCGPHSDSFNDTSRHWQKVVFRDESQFVLGTDDYRVREWRRPAYDSRSTLIVMRGTATGQRYVDDILRPHVGPFLNVLPGAIFQQDNARRHTARVVQDFLRQFQPLSMASPLPRFVPCRSHVGSAKTADALVSLYT